MFNLKTTKKRVGIVSAKRFSSSMECSRRIIYPYSLQQLEMWLRVSVKINLIPTGFCLIFVFPPYLFIVIIVLRLFSSTICFSTLANFLQINILYGVVKELVWNTRRYLSFEFTQKILNQAKSKVLSSCVQDSGRFSETVLFSHLSQTFRINSLSSFVNSFSNSQRSFSTSILVKRQRNIEYWSLLP